MKNSPALVGPPALPDVFLKGVCVTVFRTIDVPMPFLSGTQRALLRAVSQLGYCNPFLPERVEFERAALGAEFVEGEPVWSYHVEQPGPRENHWRIQGRLEPVAEQARARLQEGAEAQESDLVLYEDAV